MSLPKNSKANGSAHASRKNIGIRAKRRNDYSRVIKAACEAWLVKNQPGYVKQTWGRIELRKEQP